MHRKDFIKNTAALGLGSTLPGNLSSSFLTDSIHSGMQDRKYWISTMTKIADPVLHALSQGKLRKRMPVETRPGVKPSQRKPYTYLEAFGRLMTGMAPWLEVGKDHTAEGKLRAKYIGLVRQSLTEAVDPDSPDFMNFNEGSQPLVDTAFLAHALIKAPTELWQKLTGKTRHNIIRALKASRVIVPYNNNWVLFSAMVEAALQKFDNSGDTVRMALAVRTVEGWYKGDGVYGDGSEFHWDYYNSYVIQPFMLTILHIMQKENSSWKSHYEKALKRSRRYGEILERLIAPDGTYLAIGRSITYRFASFQLLSQLAWMQQLSDNLKPAGVRGSLTNVIRKVTEASGTFDDEGWLRIGLYGHQPHLAEGYISTGSLYMCLAVFLPLGLPPDNEFWTAAPKESIEEKIWSGKDMEADHTDDNVSL
jgi:hypothetical protein